MSSTNDAMLRQNWSEHARGKLVGKTVKDARYLTAPEMENLGWSRAALVVVFEDDSYIFASQDDEGNGPGALFTSWDDLETLPVI